MARFGAGIWYSTVGDAEGSVWKVAEVVKRVSRKCSDDVQVAAVTAADTAGCFKNCPQPTNRSSTCWTGCYFETLLGSGSGASRVSNTAGIPINDVVAVRALPLPPVCHNQVHVAHAHNFFFAHC